MKIIADKLFWIVALSLLVVFGSVRFFLMPLEMANPEMTVHGAARSWVFYTHVAASMVALAVGGFQFIARLRARSSRVHRWIGRIYVATVMLGAASGLIVAFDAVGGPVAQAGFTILAVIWAAFTFQAFRFALARDFVSHRRWMIRSFALTFAAVTLRLQLFAMIALLGETYTALSPVIAWSCWIPNLLVVERLMRAQRPGKIAA